MKYRTEDWIYWWRKRQFCNMYINGRKIKINFPINYCANKYTSIAAKIFCNIKKETYL